MTIQVQCPCGQRFAATPELIGQQVQCSTCGQAFLVQPPQPQPVQQPVTQVDLGHYPPPTPSPQLARPTAAPQKRKPAKKKSASASSGAGRRIAVMIIAVFLVIPAMYAAFESFNRSMGVADSMTEKPSRKPSVTGTFNSSGNSFNGSASLPGQSPQPSGSAWKTYQSSDGRFQIDLPGKHQLDTKTQHLPQGRLTSYIAQVEVAGGAYGAAYSRHPSFRNIDYSAQSEMLRETFRSRFSPTSQVFQDIQWQGMQGLSSTLTGSVSGRPAAIRARTFVVDDLMYELLWIGEPSAVPSAADLDRFFGSFRSTASASSVADSPAAGRPANQPTPSSFAGNESAGDAAAGNRVADTRPGPRSGGRSPRSPSFSPPVPVSEWSEEKRKEAYLKYQKEFRDYLAEMSPPAAAGFPAPPPEFQAGMEKSAANMTLSSLSIDYRVRRTDFEAIVREGDAKGWGK